MGAVHTLRSMGCDPGTQKRSRRRRRCRPRGGRSYRYRSSSYRYRSRNYRYRSSRWGGVVLGEAVDGRRIGRVPGTTFPKQVRMVRARDRTRGTITCLRSRTVLKVSDRAHPSFAGKRSRGMTLLRVSSSRYYFLFHLGVANLARPVVRLLRSPGMVGINLSLGSSFVVLRGQTPFGRRTYVRLRRCIHPFNVRSGDLRGVCNVLFDRGVSGSRHLSG